MRVERRRPSSRFTQHGSNAHETAALIHLSTAAVTANCAGGRHHQRRHPRSHARLRLAACGISPDFGVDRDKVANTCKSGVMPKPAPVSSAKSTAAPPLSRHRLVARTATRR